MMVQTAKTGLEKLAALPENKRNVPEDMMRVATSLANGEELDTTDVRIMYRYLRRNKLARYTESWPAWGKPRIKWYMMGGDEGMEWSNFRVGQMNAADKKLREAMRLKQTQQPAANADAEAVVVAPKDDLGIVMLLLSPTERMDVEGFTIDYIDPADLHENGIEDEPHITVLYGLTWAYEQDIAKVVGRFAPLTVTLGDITLFEKDEFDVVKIDVESEELRKLNQELRDANYHKDLYGGGYNPHLTLAYVQKGQGKKYVSTDHPFKGLTLTFYFAHWNRGQDKPNRPIAFGMEIQPDLTMYQEIRGLTGNAVSKTVNGREILVVPVVSAQEQVMNGELVLAEELGRYMETWNDNPVVINHPKKNNQFISGRGVDVPKFGRTYNTRLEEGKLKTEAHIDVAETNAAGASGKKLVSDLRAGKVLPVSWGWFRDPVPAQGSFKGVEFFAVAKRIVPDHLAILTSEDGACSVADGCGTHKTNALSTNCSKSDPTQVCNCGCTADLSHSNQENNIMDPDQDTPVVPPTPAPVDTPAPEPAVNSDLQQILQLLKANTEANKQLTATVASLAVKVNELETEKANQQKQERDVLINALANNSQCPFKAEQLVVFTDSQLKMFAETYRPVDYSGRAIAGYAQQPDKPFEPAMPKPVLFDKKEAPNG